MIAPHRIVVPGFKSHPAYDSSLQRDAPGGSSRDYHSYEPRGTPHIPDSLLPVPFFSPSPPLVCSVIAKFKAVHMWTLNKCSLVKVAPVWSVLHLLSPRPEQLPTTICWTQALTSTFHKCYPAHPRILGSKHYYPDFTEKQLRHR